QLNDIALLLQALIDALSQAQPTAQPQPATNGDAAGQAAATDAPQAAPVLTPADTSSALTGLAALLEGLAQAATAANTAEGDAEPKQTALPAAAAPTTPALPTLPTNENAAEDIALLKQLQSMLKNLQDSLKAVDGDTPPSTAHPDNAAAQVSAQSAATPASTIPAGQLEQLVAKAQADVNLLSLRIETASAAPAQPVIYTESEPTEATTLAPAVAPQTPATLLSIVKEGIGQIRSRLQALQQENEKTYAQARTTLEQQFQALQTSTATSATTYISTNAAPDTTSTSAIIGTNITTAAAQEAATPLPSLPVETAPAQQNAPTATLVVATTPQDTGTSTGGQNQNPNQGQSQSTTPVAGSTPAATEASREAPSFARVLTRSPSVPVQDQVAFHVKTALQTGTSSIRIELDPGDLGKIDIKLTVEANGKTGVTVLVDNKQTLELLQRDSASLARALNEAGLSADSSSLSFNLRGGQQETPQDNAQAAHTYKKAAPAQEDEAVLQVVARTHAVNLSEGLDISI
ncbi:MAG: flagellar hook-length control protein FliK, partial [Rickettsiales bacterium]|nr:flagellar hook-length control protein FliK [Rickettsiales bacterium]